MSARNMGTGHERCFAQKVARVDLPKCTLNVFHSLSSTEVLWRPAQAVTCTTDTASARNCKSRATVAKTRSVGGVMTATCLTAHSADAASCAGVVAVQQKWSKIKAKG